MPQRQTIVSIAVVAVLAIIIAGTAVYKHEQATKVVTIEPTTPTTPTKTDTTDTTSTATYKDGTYSATGHYTSPGGDEAITIKLTLTNGVVTDTSATNGATEGEGREYQDQFISGYKSQVVGKSIDSISLSRVSGSSLTSQGFNDALSQIKADAKA